MKKVFFCILSAVLSGLAFIFPFAAWLIFFAPALFCYVLFTSERPFLHGFIFGFFFTFTSSLFLLSLDLSWLFPPFLSSVLPPVALISLSAFFGVITGAFSLFFAVIKKRVSLARYPLLFSSVFVIYEFITGASFLPTGYSWGRFCVPLAVFPCFIQTASLFGMLFISFLAVFFASGIAVSFSLKSVKPLIFPAILLLLNLSLSFYLYSAPDTGEKITAAAIQTGLDTKTKRGSSVYSLADEAIKEFHGADLIVFPEANIPASLENSPYLDVLSREAEKNGVSVLMGALYKDGERNETSVYLLPGGDVSSKRHPVPFGEYTPILGLFSPDIKESNITGSDRLTPLKTGAIAAGSVICFDSIFPGYAREATLNGANILCISTNDSWFSGESSARLHLYHSVYRCIENSRWGVRSACTGISAIIDSKGNIVFSLSPGKTGRVSGEVLLKESKTLYSVTGDVPILLFSSLIIIFTLIRRKENA